MKPFLKKPGLDQEFLKNFRPVSSLSFVSKVIEKVIAACLLDHMKENGLMDPYQFAYRKGHSTEIALVQVHNDIVSAVEKKGSGVCLILLGLSAEFDTVDHTFFLTFLRKHIGLSGRALDVMESYLSGRMQCVSINGVLSELKQLECGVPQGSVLGPIRVLYLYNSTRRHLKISYSYVSKNVKLQQADFLINISDILKTLLHKC